MNNNSWFKKENPFQTVIGYGGGATGFQYHSSSASAVYVDDVYKTYLYVGNSNLNKINDVANGIKLGTGQAGASVYFNGTDDQIDYSDETAYDFGSGDFTIECWIKSKQTTSGYYTALGQWNTHTSPDYGWAIRYASQDIGTGWSFFYSTTGSNYITTMGSDISDGAWHHVAVCRSGTSLRTFTDGTLITTRTTSDTFTTSGETFKLGGQGTPGSSNYFNGRLSNVRIIKGTALYTANFTPPTEALTNVTNTIFLGCQSAIDSITPTVSPSSSTTHTGNPQPASVGPFTGTGSARGGAIITKARTAGDPWGFYNTIAGPTKVLSTNSNPYDTNAAGTEMLSFNNSGFSLGTNSNNAPNTNAQDIASFTFGLQKGFFDLVTYTGNGSTQNISHSLGSVPGMIWIKCTSNSNSWYVYHKELGATKYLMLNHNNAVATQTWFMNDTAPTSSQFSVGNSANVNGSGYEYIAYVFAGGESSAATANSVDFDGSGDYLTTNSSSDYTPGTSDFTLEYWYNPDENAVDFLVDASAGSEVWATYCNSSGLHKYRVAGTDRIVSTSSLLPGQWHHIAVVRISNTVTMYINGIPEGGTYNDTNDYTFNHLHIGRRSSDGAHEYNGKISNLRFVVGTGVYTSAFRPPTEPLTNITNTKLLCCNSSSVTGATVGTITSNGDPTASADSPFDDTDGFKFGGDSDNLEGIIKTGSYIGNGSSTGPEINCGWEPQWLLFKNTADAENWFTYDSMRGIVLGDDEKLSMPSNDAASDHDRLELTSTGFKLTDGDGNLNGSNDEIIYMAIRRPDPLVGKPPAAAVNAFAMDYGNASTTIPAFDSGFPVDFGLLKRPGSALDWTATSRLEGPNYVVPNLSDAETAGSAYVWDSNMGYTAVSWADSNLLSWMWKRGPGLDVVTYTGGGTGDIIPHNLNAVPEMIWVKNRTAAQSWAVYHKGLNGGTNPEQYYQMLNSGLGTGSLGTESNRWNNTAPTSTHFSVGGSNNTGNGGDNYVAMLFASANDADGNPISKLGYYTGDDTNDGSKAITTGFQPRFIIIKSSSNEENWFVLDSLRGLGTGINDRALYLNTTDAQGNANLVDTSATGFSLRSGGGGINADGYQYIYYAHA